MKTGKWVDLHLHSCYSDGTYTPEELVRIAVERDVGMMAIADHDVLEGSLLAEDLCRDAGIAWISGVELDTLDRGNSIHILAYGYDGSNRAFREFTAHTRSLLDGQSDTLIREMERERGDVSLAEFQAYSYNPRLGGWKALHYLMHKGLTASLKEGLSFYDQYGASYGSAGYPSIPEACRQIRAAGGHPVLAHPGESLGTGDLDAFRRDLRRVVSLGPEGIECYYPTHSPEVTTICLDLCNELGLFITTGSDDHGSFSGGDLGCLQIPPEQLRLF